MPRAKTTSSQRETGQVTALASPDTTHLKPFRSDIRFFLTNYILLCSVCVLQYHRKAVLMTLGDKLRSLRAIEGSLRGLGRPMTQSELVDAMKEELGRGLSQAYLSQIESGARPHMTQHFARAACTFLPRLPWFSCGRPGGLSRRELQSVLAHRGCHRRFLALCRSDQFNADPELEHALLNIAENRRFAGRASAPRRDSSHAWPCRATKRGFAAGHRSWVRVIRLPFLPKTKILRASVAVQIQAAGCRFSR